MKTLSISALFALLLTLSPVIALSAETKVEGTVVGYNCLVLNLPCPVDKEDPVIANERLFVVDAGGGRWYFLTNVDRAVLARHITEKVRVTGQVSDKHNALKATTIETRKGDSWKTVWSLAMEEELRAKFGSALSGP